MIRVGDVLQEPISEDKKALSIITKIDNDEFNMVEIHFLLQDGSTTSRVYMEMKDAEEDIEKNIVNRNEKEIDWLMRVYEIFNDGKHILSSV